MKEALRRAEGSSSLTSEALAHTPSAPPPPAATDVLTRWSQLLQVLRRTLPREQFETWFRRATLAEVRDDVLLLAVQNTFARDWLANYYRDAIEDAAREVLGTPHRIEFVVSPELAAGARAQFSSVDDEARASDAAAADAADTAARGPGALGPAALAGAVRGTPAEARTREPVRTLSPSSDVVLNPSYRFDNFVVGPCNRFAHAAAVGVSEAPGKAYNPFFLHGSVGLGKTHLLQSLCYALLERDAQTNILFLSCETFVNHFIAALENGDLQKFRSKYRNVDVLVVDDIHILANKERTQEEFFHTFNALHSAGKQIVLSSDSPPKDIPTLQGRLVSRFKWGLVTEIEQPCYETRMAILKRKSRERGSELPDEVARLLAERIDTNIRELEGSVTKILGYAALARAPVSPELAREALRELFTVRHGAPSLDDLMRELTEHFNVKPADLQSRRRTNAVAYPRQVGMYIARRITRMSLEEIGGFFGGRDHSTVLYAIQKIENLVREDAGLGEQIRQLEQRIRSTVS
ncbi:MAG: chromosomal replication initiator protein DnaA [Planctomycetota bacterium]|nr:MAG: chromosomal replication initiator protein DnaA [Planctomycetota bacterium]